MYLLLKLTELLVSVTPRRLGYFLCSVFAMFSYHRSKKRRHVLRQNLSNVIGKENVTEKLLKTVYKNYAMYYFDLFCSKKRLVKSMRGENMKKWESTALPMFKKALESHKGLIILSMHMTNWDLAGGYLATLFPGKINAVVEKLSPAFFKWFTETREKLGMKVIDASNVRAMVKALKNSEILVLLGDRDLDRTGYIMDFFGKKAYIPSGPAKLALMADVPVSVGSMHRDIKDDTEFFAVSDEYMLNHNHTKRSEESARALTGQIVSSMEKHISSNPGQWCMLQQVWVDAPAEQAHREIEQIEK